MKHLLNTLYILSEDIYLSLDGENVVANRDKQTAARYPLHTLQNIITFSYSGASPALMGACAERQIGFAFCTPRGKFLARVCGEGNGNVLLRRSQYRAADDAVQCCQISRTMILGKLFNARWSIERTRRDHGLRVDSEKLTAASRQIHGLLAQVKETTDLEELRGLEGVGASAYFGVLDEMILGDKEAFFFRGRSRRPPLDAVNAMLSFAYSLLAHDCASALESVGLDSYVGFLHRDRPGRTSLALDLMEELRPCMADRFVLTLINNRQVKASDFIYMESGAVLLTDEGRRAFLKGWQEKKKETLTHPYLGEKLSWGMIPYVQALLLARCLRGDLDAYPPFLWK
ncbi:type I-C CRISPR-associated endonuclease Cas1c [Oscillibacter sp. 1-3]|uniref:type I-C CRISPR-associated endonuclease Cas1c n=1 Tax=Oscillibacter sp. 1-3 TaxID=1235797 RepID=UPI0003362348|nr:type I-C CRISPR-associated endonuclease Cas1c [Oscillibacter sp. 1-3]EOS63283.1 CRISPR-associated endonuclease cas1, subtype I-c/dvulg [Oscillibacter sp. 1-3]